VLANGSFVAANSASHSDLFWALRGGGPGSWGVLTSVTLRTYPAFDATLHIANVSFANASVAGSAMAAHAHHIFDFDAARGAQYFYLTSGGANASSVLQLNTLFANTSVDAATALVQPMLRAMAAAGAQVTGQSALTAPAGAIVGFADDAGGFNTLLGSRLFSAAAYRDNATVAGIGAAYRALLEAGVGSVLGHLVAGGKVAENAGIDSAIHPKWRTAKTHVRCALLLVHPSSVLTRPRRSSRRPRGPTARRPPPSRRSSTR
jgi:hypothetical protein